MKYCTPSNCLTLSRLCLAPIVLPWLIVDYLDTAVVIFGLMASTDYFDGLCARIWRHETSLGAWLDPLADKILLASVLLPLISLNIVHWAFGLVCIVREFIVLAARHMAALHNVTIRVSHWGKGKTCVQFAYLAVCLAPATSVWLSIRYIMMILAVAITIGSMLQYLYQLIHVSRKDIA